MQSGLGSTRALACSDRRLDGRYGGAVQSRTGDPFERPRVVGEGACLCQHGRQADYGTRGRVHSPMATARFGLAGTLPPESLDPLLPTRRTVQEIDSRQGMAEPARVNLRV